MELIRKVSQVVLGLALGYAGIGHLTTNRQEFQAQVPSVLKDYADFVVVASGVVEIVLGLSLIGLWGYRVQVGWVVAAFFVAIFPGNISQYLNGIDAFGLDSDTSRLVRLFFQPLLVVWALWCTGAWRARKAKPPVTDRDDLDMENYESLGVVINAEKLPINQIEMCLSDIKMILNSGSKDKQAIIKSLKQYLPDFQHLETGKNLDQKM
jgi:uncharacterized membrane protein